MDEESDAGLRGALNNGLMVVDDAGADSAVCLHWHLQRHATACVNHSAAKCPIRSHHQHPPPKVHILYFLPPSLHSLTHSRSPPTTHLDRLAPPTKHLRTLLLLHLRLEDRPALLINLLQILNLLPRADRQTGRDCCAKGGGFAHLRTTDVDADQVCLRLWHVM